MIALAVLVAPLAAQLFSDCHPEATAFVAEGPERTAPSYAFFAAHEGAFGSHPNWPDVYSDGAFVGNAPSTLKLAPGKHTVRVTASGHKEWSREITVQSGSEVKLNAVLEKE